MTSAELRAFRDDLYAPLPEQERNRRLAVELGVTQRELRTWLAYPYPKVPLYVQRVVEYMRGER